MIDIMMDFLLFPAYVAMDILTSCWDDGSIDIYGKLKTDLIVVYIPIRVVAFDI